MFECSNGKIKITRGDSAALKVLLTMGNGETYAMDSGDVLTLTVKKRPEDGVMMKVTSDTEVIKLTPADTKIVGGRQLLFRYRTQNQIRRCIHCCWSERRTQHQHGCSP